MPKREEEEPAFHFDRESILLANTFSVVFASLHQLARQKKGAALTTEEVEEVAEEAIDVAGFGHDLFLEDLFDDEDDEEEEEEEEEEQEEEAPKRPAGRRRR